MSTNSRLAVPSADLLNHFALQQTYKDTAKNIYKQMELLPWQQEIIGRYCNFLTF
jgi:hypothetical protein